MIGLIAYEIALALSLMNLHIVFHVSHIRKYIPNIEYILKYDLS